MNAFPDAPGHRGVETSVEAAADLAPCVTRLKKLALETITAAGPDGFTAEELAETLGLARVVIQPRTTELKLLGQIVDSGQRRRNRSSGKRAIVWTLPQYRKGGAS